MNLSFSKYQGTGNDFILIDNRAGVANHLSTFSVASFCDRKFGIGADGLLLLNAHPTLDFEMVNYNADGSLSSFCGNGARTLVQFAFDLGIQKSHYRFMAADGEHEAYLENSLASLIKLKMQSVKKIDCSPAGLVMNTGSPHLVVIKDSIQELDVFEEGQYLRNHSDYQPAGVNVNFVEWNSSSTLKKKINIRTYERGVEDETLSCGTGVIASAIALHLLQKSEPGKHLTQFHTQGGLLQVQFDKVSDSEFENIWLIGPAEKTFEGKTTI